MQLPLWPVVCVRLPLRQSYVLAACLPVLLVHLYDRQAVFVLELFGSGPAAS